MPKVLLCVLVISQCLLALGAEYYTALYSTSKKEFSIKEGYIKSSEAAAWAYYDDAVEETGWAFLTVSTNQAQPDEIQAYAAGFVEGGITTTRIWQSYVNFLKSNPYTYEGLPEPLSNWTRTNVNWMQEMVKKNPADTYWQQLNLVLLQLEGLTDAYNQYRSDTPEMTLIEQFLANSDGDLEDIVPIVTGEAQKKKFRSLENSPYYSFSHCSALIKPYKNADGVYPELFSGHTTWTGYINMLRTYKIYNLYYNNPSTKSKSVSFSSYPSDLSSIDDYYITDAKLSIIETTNGIFNTTLYEYVVPQSVLSWIRAILANRMASDGKSWTEVFRKYNSGTYNNQWIVTDYNKFVAGSDKLEDGLLWILEQIPGKVQSADVTDVLRSQGYWPSYNIPYFTDIYVESGFQDAVAEYGALFTYNDCPRANIFRANQEKINGLGRFKFMLRFNEWQWDPASQGNAGNAISSRFDLVDQNSTDPYLQADAFGGIDSKVTSSELIQELKTHAISGPTFDEQRHFEWTSQWDSISHEGQPNSWNFGWEVFDNQYAVPPS